MHPPGWAANEKAAAQGGMPLKGGSAATPGGGSSPGSRAITLLRSVGCTLNPFARRRPSLHVDSKQGTGGSVPEATELQQRQASDARWSSSL